MKTICMMVLALALVAVAGTGCRVSGEVGDTSTPVSPAR
jgi:hypothetical protein